MAEHAHAEEHGHGGHGHGGHGGDHGHDDHEKHYAKIYYILLVLLVASVAGPLVADAIHDTLGDTGRFVLVLVTAFGIAFVKAYLVIKNFMHLNLEPKYVAYLCGTSLAFMGLLFFFVAPDVMKHDGNNWVNVAAQEAVARGITEGGHGEHAEPEHGVPRQEPIRLEAPTPAPTPAPAPAPAPTPTPTPAPEGEVAEGTVEGAVATPTEAHPSGLSEAERRQRAAFIRRQLRL